MCINLWVQRTPSARFGQGGKPSTPRTSMSAPENAGDPTLSPLILYLPEDAESLMAAITAGGDNQPSFGMTTVVISASRLPTWSNWNFLVVNVDEFLAIDHGGGGLYGSGVSHSCENGSMRIDWDFIASNEGNRLTAYVPLGPTGAVLGHSGVTIASGFDLGQHSVQDLTKMGLDSALVNKLTPYVGLRGSDAKNYLDAHTPVSIIQSEASAINAASHSESLVRLVAQYDAATNTPGAFYGLPARTQTAIADVAFQYGNLAGETPIFWSEIVSRDWAGAIAELRDFHDEHGTRRNSEADLIENDRVESRLLPQNICY